MISYKSINIAGIDIFFNFYGIFILLVAFVRWTHRWLIHYLIFSSKTIEVKFRGFVRRGRLKQILICSHWGHLRVMHGHCVFIFIRVKLFLQILHTTKSNLRVLEGQNGLMSVLFVKLGNRDDHQVPRMILMKAHSLKNSKLHRFISFLNELFTIVFQKRDTSFKISYIIAYIDHKVGVILAKLGSFNVHIFIQHVCGVARLVEAALLRLCYFTRLVVGHHIILGWCLGLFWRCNGMVQVQFQRHLQDRPGHLFLDRMAFLNFDG